jgi:uncharacterized protein (TIGR02466 family)
MPIRPWFPSFIYDSPLQKKDMADLLSKLLEACQAVRAEDGAGREWCHEHYPAGYTSYGTLRNLNRHIPAFSQLEQKIWPHVERFARRLDMELCEVNLVMSDCWVNVMSRDAVHPLHLHPGAVFSGTFYVSTPEGCSSLGFQDPRSEQASNAPPRFRDCRAENQKQISYPARAGKVILFESWLRHQVTANPTLSERVSISFNYTWV